MRSHKAKHALIGGIALTLTLAGGGIANAQDGLILIDGCELTSEDSVPGMRCPNPDGGNDLFIAFNGSVTDLGDEDGSVDDDERTLVRDRRTFEGGSNCALDKIGTFAEQYNEDGDALQHRIEVGGGKDNHGTQHVDYYPGPGVQTISYIVGPQEPDIWWGFGSIWEGQCGDDGFNYVEDAAGYAYGSHWQPGRLDNGHSGLVMDTRDCVLLDTVWNDLDEDGQANRLMEIDHLLDAHRAHQEVVPCDDLTSDDVEVYSVRGGNTRDTGNERVNNDGDEDDQERNASCPDAERIADIEPNGNKRVKVQGDGWRVYNFWTNKRGHDQGERKLLLSPDMNPSLAGGGSLWQWPADCMDEAIEGFLDNPNPPVVRYHGDTSFDDAYIGRQIETLQDEGLAR